MARLTRFAAHTNIGRRIGDVQLVDGRAHVNAHYYIAHLVHAVLAQPDSGDWYREILGDLWEDACMFGIDSVTTNDGVSYRCGDEWGDWICVKS